MSRAPRLSYAHAVHHVTLRCNNREFLFSEPSFALFVGVLQEMRAKFPLALYHYCLMTNHVHLLLRVGKDDTLSTAMQWLSTRFSQRFNRLAGRHGHLWEGRFRSTVIEAETYFLRCMAYVDLNPVRAGIVAAAPDYRWSGHRALRDEDPGELDFHDLYLESGPDAATRYRRYLELLAEEAARPAVSLATDYFVGTPKFVRRMERRFGFHERPAKLVERPLAPSGLIVAGPSTGRRARAEMT